MVSGRQVTESVMNLVESIQSEYPLSMCLRSKEYEISVFLKFWNIWKDFTD